MHVDARELADNSIIEGDICIIGAGAAGISIALEWMLSSKKVILLEGGGFEYEDRVQELYRGKNTGQPYFPLRSARLHYFGGTTAHWGGFSSVFDPIAFQKRDWVNLSGWPITQDDMLPFYSRAHDNLGIGNFDYSVDNWVKKDPTFVPLPLNKDYFWSKIWKYNTTPARFGEKYKNTVINAANIHLYTYANVVDIQANENVTTINEVTIKNYTGKSHKVRAKQFILACCGIQNARLLLASNKQAPKGLGNDNDNVGRYFMEHFDLNAAELWLNEKSSLKLYMLRPPRVKAELAMTPQKQAEYKILNGILSLSPLVGGKKVPPLIKTWSKDDPRENFKQIAEEYDKTKESKISRFLAGKMYESFNVAIRLEQSPNPLSRVTLDSEKDELGMPRANLNWVFTPLEKRSLRKIYEVFGQQVGAAGIGRVKLMDYLQDEKDETMPAATSGGWHHMGTTRMTEDPKTGVVDANCKVHGIDNLYAAGSSCFTTGGAVNPTLSIVAIAIRLSDHIKQKVGD